eukprot:4348142-Karenia_brevis.AAC.1
MPQSSASLRAAISTQVWVDAAAVVALAQDREPLPTCHNSEMGTRIDIILCNQSAANAIHDLRVLQDTGLPTHSPVQLDLNVQEYGQQVFRMARPRPFPCVHWPKWRKDAEVDLARR